MTRENVRRDELHKILNEELHRQDPCGACRFTQAPGLLHTPDESGCNWSQDLRHGRSGNDSCAEVDSRVITQIAGRFKLKPHHAEHPAQKPSTDKSSSSAPGTIRSRETYLYYLDEVFKIGPLDSSLAALRGILIVTLAGLQPLIDAIKNDKQNPDRSGT